MLNWVEHLLPRNPHPVSDVYVYAHSTHTHTLTCTCYFELSPQLPTYMQLHREAVPKPFLTNPRALLSLEGDSLCSPIGSSVLPPDVEITLKFNCLSPHKTISSWRMDPFYFH